MFTPGEAELFDGGNTLLTEIGLEDFSCDMVHKVGGIRDILAGTAGLRSLLESFEFLLGFFYEVFFFQFYP